MHKLLARQLRRQFGAIEDVPEDLWPLLEAVDASYVAADEDRQRIERSMEVASGELLQRQAELEDAFQRLRQVDRARARFLNTAAHELNTPLTPILLQLRLLRQALETPATHGARAVNNLDILERNVTRLGMIASDFLDSARIESGRLGMDPRPSDLVALAHACVESFGPKAVQHGIDLRLDAPIELSVTVDPHRIGQVLDNLVANALRFTGAGGTIDVRITNGPGNARVEVTDTGIGVSEEGMARLFRPFSQIHDTMEETRGGTGLGLFICKGIVEQSGGTIGVRSDGPGQGTTFYFELPRTKADRKIDAPPPS